MSHAGSMSRSISSVVLGLNWAKSQKTKNLSQAASTLAFFSSEKVTNYFRFLVYLLGMDKSISCAIISKNSLGLVCLF